MQNFSDPVQREHYQIWGWLAGRVWKCAFFNGKLAISRKRWEIRSKL